MALGIEDCLKLTRQASNDNERMAILLLIGTNFKLLSHDHLRIILSSSTDPWRSTAWFDQKNSKKQNIQIRPSSMIQIQKNSWTDLDIHFVEN